MLMNDHLLFKSNCQKKRRQTRSSVQVQANALVYKIINMGNVQIPENYQIDFHGGKVKSFLLASLVEIITTVEQSIKRGIKKDHIFFSDGYIMVADNL